MRTANGVDGTDQDHDRQPQEQPAGKPTDSVEFGGFDISHFERHINGLEEDEDEEEEP